MKDDYIERNRIYEQLRGAVESGDFKDFADAVHRGVELEYAFGRALLKGNAEMVRLTLNLGVDPNKGVSGIYEYQQSTGSMPPLMVAVREGHEEVARLLLERGADPNCEHRFGTMDDGADELTALGKAIATGHAGMVKLLLEHGASTGCVYASGGFSMETKDAYEWAESAGTREIRDLLAERQKAKWAETRTEETHTADEEEEPSTEADWLECGEGGPAHAISVLRDDPSKQRKLFLAGCGWARRFWDRLGRRSRTAVEVYERLADGETPQGDYVAAMSRFEEMFAKQGDYFAFEDVKESEMDFFTALIQARAAWQAALPYLEGDPDAERAIVLPARGVYSLGRGAYLDASDEFAFASGNPGVEYQEQCNILWDIFGNVVSRVTLEPAWLTQNGGAAEKIARAIYDERAFGRMPELADALVRGGCYVSSLLSHCYLPKHVRGCWVLDLLLGKDGLAFPLGARMPLAFLPE